jgi:hypothetical protein
VLDGGPHPVRVVAGDERQARAVDVAGDEDGGGVVPGERADGLAVARRRRDDEAVAAARLQLADGDRLARGVVVGVGDEARESGAPERLLDAADDRRQDGVREVRDDDTDEARAPRAQAAGGRVGPVAELVRGGADAGRRRLGDPPRQLRV